MKILLKSATVTDSQSPYNASVKDILIENGKISKIADAISANNCDKIIDLPDLHISRGWFDSSVSFGEPGFEERETLENGASTAARSGFTDVVLLPNLKPVTDTGSQVAYLKERAREFVTRLHVAGALTVGMQGNSLAEMFDMHRNGALYFIDTHRGIENAQLLKMALQYTLGFKGIVSSFPADKHLIGEGVIHEGEYATLLGLKGIPPVAEHTRISRDLQLLAYTGGRLHIPTISCAKSVALIRDAKKQGLDVSCSVNILHLGMRDTDVEDFNTDRKILPPLREEADAQSLIEGLKDGTIDMVTSDHKPMDVEHKKVEFDLAAFGSIHLESAFGMLNKHLPLEMSIEKLTAGAQRFGVKIPSISVGEQACITLFNPNVSYAFGKEHILSTNSNAAALGKTLKGKAYGIISGEKMMLAQ